MRATSGFPWLFPALVAVLCPGTASAQEVSATEHEEAVTHFQAGRRFVEQKDCKSAIPRFVESIRHEENIGARFNLAACSEEEGRHFDAWNHYKGAEQLAIKKNDEERRKKAHDAAAALEPKVLKLRLVLPKNVPSFTVKIDHRVVEKPDYPLLETAYAVEPGRPHTIEVTAPKHASWKAPSELRGAAGAELPAMVVDLGAPLEAESADVGSGQRLAGLVVGGVGIAALAVGGIFGLLASSNKSDAQSACGDPPFSFPDSCDPAGGAKEKEESAQARAMASTIAFVAGGVLVAGGAVLYLTAPKRSSSARTGRLHLAPAIGAGTTGALLGGTF